ncbi:MAG: signal peptidase I [Acidobacteriota bacterium]
MLETKTIRKTSKQAVAVVETVQAARKHGVLREYFELIVVTVIFTLFLQTFVVQAFQIPSSSMEDNLLVGDHLLVNKSVYSSFGESALASKILPFKEPRRGDIVVFKYPEDPTKDFVKRVIGLPGDTVEIRSKTVYVNGKAFQEPYKYHKDSHIFSPFDLSARPEAVMRDNYGPVTVPAGDLFVMGDNRDNSHDSRYWGFLPRTNLKGKPLIIYWSYAADKESYLYVDYGSRLKNILNTIIHFPTRTRWSRFFKIIR